MKLEDLIIDTMKNDDRNKFQLTTNIADFIGRFIRMMEMKPIREWRKNYDDGRELLTHMKLYWMVNQFLNKDIKEFGLSEDDDMPPCNNVGDVLAANIAFNLANILEEVCGIDVKIDFDGEDEE